MSSPDRIATVIACHDERRWPLLEAAVDSVRHQDLPCEVVIAVDGNEALHRRVRAASTADVVVLNSSLRGASPTRNAGVAATSADIIAFLDDDAVAERGWLSALVAPLGDPATIGTGGKVLPDWALDAPRWYPPEFLWVVGATWAGMPTSASAVRNVWAENMAIRRQAFLAVGGFRSTFGKVGDRSRPEDTDLCIRAAAATGGRWIYQPAAVVSHHVPAHRATLGYFLRRSYHEGAGKAELSSLTDAPVSDVLGDERAFVRDVCVAAAGRYAAGAVRGDGVTSVARLAALSSGLAAAGLGYGRSRVATAARRHRTHATPIPAGAR